MWPGVVDIAIWLKKYMTTSLLMDCPVWNVCLPTVTVKELVVLDTLLFLACSWCFLQFFFTKLTWQEGEEEEEDGRS